MKRILFAVLASLCVVVLLRGQPVEKPLENSEKISILIATDLHYLSPELTDKGTLFQQIINAGDGKVVHYVEELTDAFLAEVVEQKPDVLVLSGDLTLNGAVKSHKGLIKKLSKVQQAGVQVLVIPGNHDVDSEYAVAFRGDRAEKADALSSEDFFAYYEAFGPEQAISRDTDTFSYIYPAGDDLWIAMLDANCYGKGYLKDSTLTWLEKQLKKAEQAGIHVIAVNHQNLYAHNSLMSFGYQLYNAGDLQKLLERYAVKCHFSGHIHMQSIVEAAVTEIATSSVAVGALQYGSIVYEDGVLEYTTRKTDVAGWAAEKGSKDETLLRFGDYAMEFFEMICRNQVFTEFAESTLSEEEKELLAATYAKLNAAYFAGEKLDVSEFSEGLALWKEQTGTFFKVYIDSMLETIGAERQAISIHLK